MPGHLPKSAWDAMYKTETETTSVLSNNSQAMQTSGAYNGAPRRCSFPSPPCANQRRKRNSSNFLRSQVMSVKTRPHFHALGWRSTVPFHPGSLIFQSNGSRSSIAISYGAQKNPALRSRSFTPYFCEAQFPASAAQLCFACSRICSH
jgi:hypothetical protein